MNTLKKKKSKVEEFQEFPGGPVVGLQALTVCLRHSFSLCSGNLNSHKPHGAAKKERTYPMTNSVETSPLDKVSLSIPSLLPNLSLQ